MLEVMKSGLDLKKDITVEEFVGEELAKFGIPDVHKLKLKPSNRSVKNYSSSVKNTVLKKIGNNTPVSLDHDDLSSDFLILESYKSVSDLLKEGLYEELEEDSFLSSLRSLAKTSMDLTLDDVYVGELKDKKGFSDRFITVNNNKFEFRKEGVYRLMGSGGMGFINVLSLNKLKGILYLFKIANDYFSGYGNIDSFILDYYDLVIASDLYEPISIYENEMEIIDEFQGYFESLRGIDFYDLSQSGEVIERPDLLFRVLPGKYNIERSRRFKICLTDLLSGEYVDLQNTFYGLRSSRGVALGEVMDTTILMAVYDMVVCRNIEEVKRGKEVVNSNKSYARSFETKQNIPLKTLERMESSKFLSHFDYVEYDELVDLDKLDQIEEDWKKLLEKVEFPKTEGHSLRFRRLGKLRANGAYYPYQNALVVDIGTTDSFAHEYFHLVDYKFSNSDKTISSSIGFRKIKSMYKRIALELLEDDRFKDYKKRVQSSGKYNIDYYLGDKEIFARCGELYLRNIDSHLIGNKLMTTPFYPNDESLLSEIDAFFKELDIIKIK